MNKGGGTPENWTIFMDVICVSSLNEHFILLRKGILKERLWPLITTDDIMKYVAFNISILYLHLHLLFIAVFQKDSLLRRISIRWLSVARMTHFAGKCFLFNLHLKRMKFGLFCKATCFKQKANHNKLNKNFFDFRSSHQRCSVRKGVPKNFANFTEKRLCWNLFLIKLQTFSALKLY